MARPKNQPNPAAVAMDESVAAEPAMDEPIAADLAVGESIPVRLDEFIESTAGTVSPGSDPATVAAAAPEPEPEPVRTASRDDGGPPRPGRMLTLRLKRKCGGAPANAAPGDILAEIQLADGVEMGFIADAFRDGFLETK